jgi:hypothetical protein
LDLLRSVSAIKDANNSSEFIQFVDKLNSTKHRINTTTTKAPKFNYNELCENSTTITSFIEDPFICNRYIRCNHGLAQKFKCSLNTAWDLEKKICLWTESVNCGSRVYVDDDDLLGDNDSDELVKLNITTKTSTTLNNNINSTNSTRSSKIKIIDVLLMLSLLFIGILSVK